MKFDVPGCFQGSERAATATCHNRINGEGKEGESIEESTLVLGSAVELDGQAGGETGKGGLLDSWKVKLKVQGPAVQ